MEGPAAASAAPMSASREASRELASAWVHEGSLSSPRLSTQVGWGGGCARSCCRSFCRAARTSSRARTKRKASSTPTPMDMTRTCHGSVLDRSDGVVAADAEHDEESDADHLVVLYARAGAHAKRRGGREHDGADGGASESGAGAEARAVAGEEEADEHRGEADPDGDEQRRVGGCRRDVGVDTIG